MCTKAAALYPCQVLTTILGESLVQTPFFTILKFDEKNHVEIMAAESLVEITRITEKRALDENARKITLEIFMLQWGNTQCTTDTTDINISNKLYNFYNEKVCCDINAGLQISVGTIDQSQNSEWSKERKLRLTASNGHRVKGTRYDVDKVTTSLLTPKKIETSVMSYGKKIEDHALREYQKLLNSTCKVIKVGLIICLLQLWFSCSQMEF